MLNRYLYFYIVSSPKKGYSQTAMMKKLLLIACVLFMHCALLAQSPDKLTGDWMRVTALYSNGGELPYNHPARIFQRYYFTKDKALIVLGNTTTPMEYTLTSNQLKLGPAQIFTVEQRGDKEMVFLEIKNSVRYYFIPTDSFTVSGIIKHSYKLSNTDTVYTSALGIEPLYPEGSMAFMKHIMQSFDPVDVSFEFTYVVQKDGSIGAVEIVLSTNEKYNKRLIQSVRKTSGKWLPGAINGKPVNVQTKGNITLTRSRSR
jgi:hypothetical protein